MNNKFNKPIHYLTGICNVDSDRVIKFFREILKINNQQLDRPGCPNCGSMHIIQNGRKKGKQRFLCHDCWHIFKTTNIIMDQSYYTPSVGAEFKKIL